MSRPSASRSRRGKAARKPIAARAPSRWRRFGDLAALALVAAHATVLWLMTLANVLPAWLGAGWVALSALTALVYGRDKRAARLQARRVPETVLHLLELAGGWPGALLAQRWLRHKNRKPSYQFAFWACVVLHEAALGHLWRLAANRG